MNSKVKLILKEYEFKKEESKNIPHSIFSTTSKIVI